MPLYDRAWAVEILPPIVAPPFRIEGLRVSFLIKKDTKKQSNTAEIRIYNLSEDTRARVRELDSEVVVYAGYVGSTGAEVLFRGNIVTVSHAIEAPDIITRIEADDGGKKLRGANHSKSYAPGSSAIKVLEDMVKSLGLPVKGSQAKFELPARLKAKLKDNPYLQGFAFDGPTRDGLDKLADRLGLEYSVQNAELKLLIKEGVDDAVIPLVTPDSGLLNSPERLSQLDDTRKEEKRQPGWKISCLLQPKVEPGGRLAVQSREIPKATAFRVERVEHTGDSHGADWRTVAEVVEPGVVI